MSMRLYIAGLHACHADDNDDDEGDEPQKAHSPLLSPLGTVEPNKAPGQERTGPPQHAPLAASRPTRATLYVLS